MPRSITVTGLPFTNFSKIGWSMIPGLLANSRRDRDTHSLWRAAATFKGLTQAPQGCQMCAKRLSSAQMSKNSHALSGNGNLPSRKLEANPFYLRRKQLGK